MQLRQRNILANANTGPRSERQQRLLHDPAPRLGLQPALGRVLVGIVAEDARVVVHDARVAADAPPGRDEGVGERHAGWRRVPLHAEPHAGVQAHGFFDGGAGVGELRDGFGVADGRAEGRSGRVDFFAAFGELAGVLHQVVDGGSHGYGGGVGPGQPGVGGC